MIFGICERYREEIYTRQVWLYDANNGVWRLWKRSLENFVFSKNNLGGGLTGVPLIC